MGPCIFGKTGEKAWNIQWACNHLMISTNTWDHMIPVLESEMTLVKGSLEMDGPLDMHWSASEFLKKGRMVNGSQGTMILSIHTASTSILKG